MNKEPNKGLQLAAEKASHDPFFLGHLLSFVAEGVARSGSTLSQRIGCNPGQITRLALCRCPREDGIGFRQDIEKIAAYVGCDAMELAQVVREGAALKALAGGGIGQKTNTLLAARDRLPKHTKPDDPKGGGNG